MEWAFLWPWRDAIRSHSTREEPPRPCIRVNLLCCPAQWKTDYYVSQNFVRDGSILLLFNTQEHTHELAQRLREAMELFNMLATVANAAFVSLLSEVMLEDGLAGGNTVGPRHQVCPEWKCRVVTKITGCPAEVEDTMTWAKLLGCLKDPWEYSPGFRDAMNQLIALGQSKTGSDDKCWSSCCRVGWYVRDELLPIFGRQDDPSHEIQPTTSPELFAREFGKRLGFEAPQVVHLCAVSDRASLLEQWRREGPAPRSKHLENSALTLEWKFAAPNVPEITSALARGDIASIFLRLDDHRSTEHHERGLALQNAGFLFTTLMSGLPYCQSLGVDDGVVMRSGGISDVTLVYPGASEMIMSSFYSAAAVSTLTSLDLREDIYLPDEYEDIYLPDEYDHGGSYNYNLQWLAYALWSKEATTSIQHVDFQTYRLTARDVALVRSVLTHNYPAPLQPNSSLSQPPQYGFVELKQGTEVHPRTIEAGDGTLFTLSRGCRCRAVYDSTTMANRVDAVIPGYGICSVALLDGTCFTADIPEESGYYSRGFEFFKVFLEEIESDAVLISLFKLVGGQLHKLCFECRESVTEDLSEIVTVDLSALAQACPQLKELSLRRVRVVISDYNDALRNWSLTKVKIYGTLTGFGYCLKDPAYAIANTLVNLSLRVPNNHDLSIEEAELMPHNGELLRVVKENVPTTSKAALISVWASRRPSKRSTGALLVDLVGRMDKNLLALIFSFAATPEKRSVEVIREAQHEPW